jgi:hypothetical protein
MVAGAAAEVSVSVPAIDEVPAALEQAARHSVSNSDETSILRTKVGGPKVVDVIDIVLSSRAFGS